MRVMGKNVRKCQKMTPRKYKIWHQESTKFLKSKNSLLIQVSKVISVSERVLHQNLLTFSDPFSDISSHGFSLLHSFTLLYCKKSLIFQKSVFFCTFMSVLMSRLSMNFVWVQATYTFVWIKTTSCLIRIRNTDGSHDPSAVDWFCTHTYLAVIRVLNFSNQLILINLFY